MVRWHKHFYMEEVTKTRMLSLRVYPRKKLKLPR
jgi:hypothetical protein